MLTFKQLQQLVPACAAAPDDENGGAVPDAVFTVVPSSLRYSMCAGAGQGPLIVATSTRLRLFDRSGLPGRC
jgi:hypothetical protein